MLPFARNLECCAPPLLSRNPGPCSCGQVLIVNFVLFLCLPAELFRRHGKPPVARRTAREARGVCVSSRTAQAEQGEGGDDEDQAWFVCPFRVRSDFASEAAQRDVEEPAPATADPVEGAKQDVPRSVLLPRCFARFPSPATGSCRSPTTARPCHQRTANSTRCAAVRAGTVGKCRASQRHRGSGEVGNKGREGRSDGRQGQGRARQGQAGGREGQGGGQSKRPGRTRAGRGFCVCSCCCCLWFAALQHGHRLLFGALLVAKSASSFTVLACSTWGVGGAFGSEGSWLLQVQANLVALCVLPRLQNGVSVLGSMGGGGQLFCARFALALQVAVVSV